MTSSFDKSKPYFPLSGGTSDGYNKAGLASATCFCGVVQIEFPTTKPGLIDTFLCNCTDCRKITASTFASNFIVTASHTKFNRGAISLSKFSQSKTIKSGGIMSNYFCSKCGTLMYREGAKFPGVMIMRIGTVDDFSLHDGILKPRVEQYVEDRVSYLCGAEGVIQVKGTAYSSKL